MGDTLPPKGNLREGFEAKVSQYTIKDRILKLVVETSARNVNLNNLAELQNCSVIVGLFEQQIPMKMGGVFRQTTSAYGGGKQCAAYLEAAEGVEKRCLHNEGHEGLHKNVDGTEWVQLDPNQAALPESDADAQVGPGSAEGNWYFGTRDDSTGEPLEFGPFSSEGAARDAVEANAAAMGIETDAIENSYSIYQKAALVIADQGWYFLDNGADNPEHGPYESESLASEGINMLLADGVIHDITGPYQKSTGELAAVEERASDEEIAETAAAYAETPGGEMDQAREDALFGKEIDTELGADVAARIQAERMSQFAPTDEQKVADVFAQIDARGEPQPEPEDDEPTYQRDDDGSTRIKKGRRSRAAA